MRQKRRFSIVKLKIEMDGEAVVVLKFLRWKWIKTSDKNFTKVFARIGNA
jgi:hypothetical protein